MLGDGSSGALTGEAADRQLTWLRLLVETTDDLSSTLRISEVLEKVADRVQSLVNCQVFCVMLWNERREVLETTFSKRFDERFDIDAKDGFPLGYGISGSAAAARRPQRVGNVARDPRYVHLRQAELDVRSELAIPLLARDRLVGVLDLESDEYEAFTPEHERMLMSLGSRIAVALENARLYEEVSLGQRQLAGDLAVAREVQKALLPDRAPDVTGFQLGFAYVPARTLGGDFYDFLTYPDGRVAVAVGDVAGKATPAALYGSLAVGMMRGHAVEQLARPDAMLAALNDQLCVAGLDDRFLAMSFALLETPDETGGGGDGGARVHLANAGLPAPFIVRADGVERAPLDGLALGIEPGMSYSTREVPLAPGDVLALCSDGLVEGRDKTGEMFGTCRLSRQLQGLAGESAQEIADQLVLGAARYAVGNEDQADDRTVVVIKAV